MCSQPQCCLTADPVRISWLRAQPLVHVNDAGSTSVGIGMHVPDASLRAPCIQLYAWPSWRLMAKAADGLPHLQIDPLCCCPIDRTGPCVVQREADEHGIAEVGVRLQVQTCQSREQHARHCRPVDHAVRCRLTAYVRSDVMSKQPVRLLDLWQAFPRRNAYVVADDRLIGATVCLWLLHALLERVA